MGITIEKPGASTNAVETTDIDTLAELNDIITDADLDAGLELTQVYHVAKAGDDGNDGLSPSTPMQTIGAACSAVTAAVPATNNRFAVRILDAGIYSENITMPSWTILSGPAATIVGNHTLVDDSCIHVSCIQAASGTAVIKSTGTAAAILRANKMELTGNATGVACTSSGAIDAHVSHVDVANGIAFGSIAAAQMFHVEALHVDISGTGICLVSALGGDVTGEIDFIEDAGAGTAISATGTTTINVSCNKIDTNVAYNIGAGCTMNLFVNDLSGTETAVGEVNVTRAGNAPLVAGAQSYYVGIHGDDADDGMTIDTPFRTIGAAVSAATAEAPAIDNQFVIKVLDAGTYPENIVLTDWIHLDAPMATLEAGATQICLNMDDNTHARFRRMDVATGKWGVSLPAGATQECSVRCEEIIAVGTGIGVLNIAFAGQGRMHLHADEITCENGFCVGDVSNNAGHVHLYVGNLYVTGTGTALARLGSGDTLGFVHHIKDIGAGVSTGIQVSSGTVDLVCTDINMGADNAYNVAPAGTLNLFVNELTGGEVNAGTANVTKAGVAPDHAIDNALHTVGSLTANHFPINDGGVIGSSASNEAKMGICTATTRAEIGAKTWIYGSIDYAGSSTGSLIYSTQSDGPLKLIHANRIDGVGNIGLKIGVYHAGTTPQMNPVDIGYYDSVGTTWYPLLTVEGSGNLAANQRENGQSAEFKSLTEETTITTTSTVDTTIEIPQYAQVYAVSVRVTTAIAGTATFTVGTAADALLFSGVGRTVASTLNATDPCTAGGMNYFNAATKVRITPNATPSDALGRVRVTIHYIEVTPPTS
jgi:hypothetical protein